MKNVHLYSSKNVQLNLRKNVQLGNSLTRRATPLAELVSKTCAGLGELSLVREFPNTPRRKKLVLAPRRCSGTWHQSLSSTGEKKPAFRRVWYYASAGILASADCKSLMNAARSVILLASFFCA